MVSLRGPLSASKVNELNNMIASYAIRVFFFFVLDYWKDGSSPVRSLSESLSPSAMA